MTDDPRSIRTIAGTGVAGYSGDGGPGTAGQVANPFGLAIGSDGALYFCEVDNHCVRRLDTATKTLSTMAGSGHKGYSGDGGPATDAELNEPYEIRFDAQCHLYIVEMQNHIVRRVDAQSGIISTIAGTGEAGFSGDGGPASAAQLHQPHSIELDGEGNLYIADIANHRLRRVDLDRGTIDTVSGTGEQDQTEDGAGLADVASNGPRTLAIPPPPRMTCFWHSARGTRSTASTSPPGRFTTSPGPARADTAVMAAGPGTRSWRARKGSRCDPPANSFSPTPRATPFAVWIRMARSRRSWETARNTTAPMATPSGVDSRDHTESSLTVTAWSTSVTARTTACDGSTERAHEGEARPG